MRRTVLFVHNNFPAQYRHLAKALSSHSNYRLFAFGSPTAREMPGVELLKYKIDPTGPDVDAAHPFARRFNAEAIRAEQTMYLAMALRSRGITPDIIFVHPGWGESLPLRALYPEAKIIVFCEFYYQIRGADVGFDPEFPQLGVDGLVRVQLRNAASLLALAEADGAISPTRWQRQLYPPEFLSKIDVIHDGIDVDEVTPSPTARLTLPHNRGVLKPGDKVVTFVARNLEPYRGIHIFLRALPWVLAAHPDAQIVIVGGQDVSYGSRSVDGRNWPSVFMDEIGGRVDRSRIHFMGTLKRDVFLKVLQVSAAHVYLTYPFVLSWSMLEAMAAGCLIIGSDTEPVREVIRHGQNGLLVPFFEPESLARQVDAALRRPEDYSGMRRAARRLAVEKYAVTSCVQRQIDFIDKILSRPRLGHKNVQYQL